MIVPNYHQQNVSVTSICTKYTIILQYRVLPPNRVIPQNHVKCILYMNIVQNVILKMRSDLLLVVTPVRVVWNTVRMDCGDQSVEIPGMRKMHKLYADSWDIVSIV